MIGVFCWTVCESCMLRSCILRTLRIVYKNSFWVAAWRWLYKEAETCRWYDLLIIFYIIKVVLDYKLIYIYIYTINYWKHNGDASPENHSRYRLVYGDHKIRALQGWVTNWTSFKFHNPDSRLQQDTVTERAGNSTVWIIGWSHCRRRLMGPWAQVLTPLDLYSEDIRKKWVQIQGAHMAVIGTISSCAFRTSLKEVFTVMLKPRG